MEEKWKKRHPGVPREWQQIGEGGNAIVWKSGDFAIKRLKGAAGGEARARFQRECSLMAEWRDRPGLKIVPVQEVRSREGADEIVMDALDGNLDDVIDHFRCHPAKAASALICVVETLAVLSADERAVHHRDLKPSNLLYKITAEDLYLGDFGCAYLANDERITPDLRALGAWAYRSPEYSSGRAENVDEKGDVFSLGKVLWSMINGHPGVTFPGPVWFLPEYDLMLTCAGDVKTAEAMYIIGRCCSIRPEERPSLRDLIGMLKGLMSDESPTEFTIKANALKREQEREIEYAQRQAITRPFVTRIVSDFEQALIRLHETNPQSLLIQTWFDEWSRLENPNESLIQQVVIHESDAPLVNVLRRQQQFITRFYPEGMNGRLRFCASFGAARLTVEAADTGLVARIEGLSPAPEVTPYATDAIPNFLVRAVDAA